MPDGRAHLDTAGRNTISCGPEMKDDAVGCRDELRDLREALEIRRKRLGAAHWETGETQSALGACLMALGRLDAAETQLIQGHQVLRQVRPENDTRLRRALERLRRVQRQRVVAVRN